MGCENSEESRMEMKTLTKMKEKTHRMLKLIEKGSVEMSRKISNVCLWVMFVLAGLYIAHRSQTKHIGPWNESVSSTNKECRKSQE